MTDTYSEEHKLNCLARYVCDMPELWRRRRFMRRWKELHSEESYKDLCERVWNEFEARKEK